MLHLKQCVRGQEMRVEGKEAAPVPTGGCSECLAVELLLLLLLLVGGGRE